MCPCDHVSVIICHSLLQRSAHTHPLVDTHTHTHTRTHAWNFCALQRDLANVTEEEWEKIPDAADIGKKMKRAKRTQQERFTPLPDSVMGLVSVACTVPVPCALCPVPCALCPVPCALCLRADKLVALVLLFVTIVVSQGQEQSNFSSLDTRQQKYGGLQTPMPGAQTLKPGLSFTHPFTHSFTYSFTHSFTHLPVLPRPTKGDVDMLEVGAARGTLMRMNLDQISDSVTGQTVVDPKGYLTDLNSLTPNFSGDIG